MNYRPIFHGAAGPYDEIVAVVGMIIFVILLIRLLLFDGQPEHKGRPKKAQAEANREE